ncbi:MAG: CDP-alcohol phosphatidyltransferase family protein, partial [Oceanisphaera sp.]|nr:CDP-alcohol phosphatidyltransferase family protein [Oceanisphaera sp.]
ATAGFLTILPLQASTGLLYLPAVLYTVAAALDGLDGFVARRQQQTTRLGTELDTALDAFGLLIAPLFAVFTGKLPVVYLLVSVAYYLFQWGIRWRRQRRRPVYALPPSQIRRYLAGAQMVLVALALWPPLPGALTQWVGLVLMIPLLIGFCRDWLHVSGRLGVRREPAA